MMEQVPENNPGQSENSAATAAASLGRTLRETRQHLGLSVADVANQIKFAPRQIEALEADDFQRLPEAAFLRGFVRSYAKILQLDSQTLLAALPQTKNASMELAPVSVEVQFPDARSLVRQNLYWLGAALLLAVIAGGFAVWNFVSPLKQSKVQQVETPLTLPSEVQIIPLVPGAPVTVSTVTDEAKAMPSVPAAKNEASKIAAPVLVTQPAAQPVAPTQAQLAKTEVKTEPTSWWFSSSAKRDAKPEGTLEIKPEAKPVTPLQAQAAKSETSPAKPSNITQLRLEFGEDSWTEIKDRDGKIISSQINPRGSELIVYGRAPFTMLIGHGLSARLYRQGKPVDLTPYINKYSEVAHVTLN